MQYVLLMLYIIYINMNGTNTNIVSKDELTSYEWSIFRLLDTQIKNYKHG